MLSDKEEKDLYRLASEGDTEARKSLVVHNDKLVVSIAQKYKGMGVPVEDLVMAGFEGLIEGIDKFDPDRGNRLSTYVTWWIRQKITRELNENGSTIKCPRYVSKLKRKLDKLKKETGEELTLSEVQEKFEVSKEVAKKAKQGTHTSSLDAEISGVENGYLKELIENKKAEPPSDVSLKELQGEKLREAMDKHLADRERRIVKLYYGLEDHNSRTLQEVGNVFDLSRERVRQLKERALEKLSTVKELRTTRFRGNGS